MAIAEVNIEWSQRENITDEQLAKMNAAVIYGEGWKRDDDGKIGYWSHCLVNIDEWPHDVAFNVKRMIDHPAFESLERKRNPSFNQKVKVSVPGTGLLNINDVVVHTDLCTEQLQRELNNGWCIVAVCVQPDQRRPDYILGRHVPSPRS